MAVSREDLQGNRFQDWVRQTELASHLLSEADLDASLEAALAAFPTGEDVWLFGYGSLIWNPMIHFAERQPAVLHGFHRGFYLHSRINRGTPQRPGLVLALDRGGACRGVAFRIVRSDARAELRMLWRREMLLGSYAPRCVPVQTSREKVTALAFVIRRDASGYAPRQSDERVVETLLASSGLYGNGIDYLNRTVEGLLAHGIRDPYLLRLKRLADQKSKTESATAGKASNAGRAK